jgi:hypothetical protein
MRGSTGFLLPADEQSAVAVEPGEGAFHDSAFGSLGGVLGEAVGFFVAGFDGWGDVEDLADLDDGLLAVAAVKADDALLGRGGVGGFVGRRGSRRRAGSRECWQRQSRWRGDTASVHQEAPFRALFRSVGGVGAGIGGGRPRLRGDEDG